ncbi:MAG: hypothetical protein COZ37_06215 [bacterium (Candidatus Ratteibacteria) CG_4_10_14_3_um_filter_41_18]|uniref:Polymerase/histidinol phosphatase N-terminal domain-containing protein n=4 Tax=Candidatus Ratteibacteria TaxID=2979319 RepID=A0A2M7YH54_9BACT|nr:MAG: hypothetical protein AUJ76_03515 [Candidatus Omnitrophica bacterium CG1_02_41_171]PIV63385.1 MAG: hypothetical protein COS11_07735 [bacterium (Candidatus Ratteibacteria) CG01_land_8_20_14_3_00_40_19]PIW33401.1 MAG: hypothetical protein COW28_04000 [bacterium (Candidatus Ratteibacteria) CG15_BIG_FIL_POST_REV_8_21_14_020_41_12]PIX76768.1 MAG: hypothetical protein COZ37_06215 [bacterium (Candidatus Ratteibacteria) CG_4_10_14_3_um_filter_41_18]PJA62294.1 MAG: hypothetical protein CO162_0187
MAIKIEFNNPFSAEGNWYKGNLHTHTDNSDGELSPREVISLYHRRGYKILSLTDHYKLTYGEELKKEGICLIPGEEIDGGQSAAGTSFHIVALNITKEITFANKEEITAQEIINRIKAENGEALIAHPYWSGLTLHDILPLEGYLGIEVFNSTCLNSIGKGESSVHWDNLLAKGKRISGFATDDTHGYSEQQYHPMDMGKGWIMVKAISLNRETIMDSIKKGLFYASCGPGIKNLSIEKEIIKVETSPVSSITFIASASQGGRISTSSTLTQAEYEIRGGEKYIRIECADNRGRKAWTSPLFLTNQSGEYF